MREYVDLIREILDHGHGKDDRTGVGNVGIVGAQMRTNLAERFPALTVRKVAPRIAFEELMFMLNGKSNTKELEDKNINIWKGNTSKEFQKKMNLGYLKEGDFGRMYGVQLREFTDHHWTGTTRGSDSTPLFEVRGFDQLEYIIEELTTNKMSRRIIATQYNPAEADHGVLFPCHIMVQFIVQGNKLNCVYWMRSSDTIFGLPYNHMYYAFFTMMLAQMLGFEYGDLVYQAGDSHIYNNQLEMANDIVYDRWMKARNKNQLFKPIKNPKVEFTKPINDLNDLLTYEWKDVIIHDYDPLPDFKDKPPMAI